MTDEDLGREIVPPNMSIGWDGWEFERMVRLAREVLGIAAERPEVTREELVRKAQLCRDKWNTDPNDDRSAGEMIVQFMEDHHFAPPREARPIDGMSVGQIEKAMLRAEGVPNTNPADRYLTVADAARVAHRLAQPVPKVDSDADGKRVAWLHYTTMCPEDHKRDYKTPDHLWALKTPDEKAGWRAVAAAKEAGREDYT